MHKQLALRLLGAPEIRLDDQPLTAPVAAKAQALLYYLALTGRAHTRSALAGLLWGDMPEEMARTNLRKALADLRPVANGYLLSDNQMIGLKPEPTLWVDVKIFAGALKSPESQNRQQALDLYRGDLLEGFYVRNAPDFENWLVSERSHYRQKVVQALHNLAADYAQQGALSEAIGTLRRLLTLEPWDETSQRTLMVWLAQSGQRSAALAQFEACRRALEAELAVEPDEETVALYEQIRAGKLDKVTRGQGDRETGRWGDGEMGSRGERADLRESHLVTLSPSHSILPAPLHNLPEPLTPLVGRSEELRQLEMLLAKPDCRLLTIVGPGGMGKTRLAIEAARVSAELGMRNAQFSELPTLHSALRTSHFPDGVFFVPLAAVSAPMYTIPAIAGALGFSFNGQLDAQTQLFNYLRQKQMLLVLDNLEHLLNMPDAPDAGLPAADVSIELLLYLLQAVPALKILATAREPLNLAGEWLFDLQGLRTPCPVSSALPAKCAGAELLDSDVYAAPTFFLQVARRVKSDFTLTDSERIAVARICHLVDGLPLGIELAASWVRALSCQEIADEIQHNLAFLSTTQRGIPARHRSMQAVFDYSWQLLAEEEQHVLCALSVFRGGFTRSATMAVTGASLTVLSTLLAKSLVRRSDEQRYDLHELVRHYAAAKLALTPAEQVAIRQRHGDYFLTLLADHEKALYSSGQKTALIELNTEIDNIRSAWDWAITQPQPSHLRACAWAFFYFFQLQNYFQEGEATFRRTQSLIQNQLTQTSVEDRDLAITQLYLSVYLGWFTFRLGDVTAGYTLLTETVARLRCQEGQALLHEAIFFCGAAGWYYGRFSEAEPYLRESLALSQAHQKRWFVAYNTIILGGLLQEQGNYQEAHRLLREGLAISRALGDPHAITLATNHLSRTLQTLGRHDEIAPLLQEALQLAHASGDRLTIGFITEQLAGVADAAGDVAGAWRLFEESGSLYRQTGSNWSLLRVLNQMGNIALSQTNLSEARNNFLDALRVAQEANMPPRALDALVGLAVVLREEETMGMALELATLVQQHAAATQEARDRARCLSSELALRLTAEEVAIAHARFHGKSLEAIIAEVLTQSLCV